METCSTWPSVQTMCSFSAWQIVCLLPTHRKFTSSYLWLCIWIWQISTGRATHFKVYIFSTWVSFTGSQTLFLQSWYLVLMSSYYLFINSSLVTWFSPKLMGLYWISHVLAWISSGLCSFLPPPINTCWTAGCKWVHAIQVVFASCAQCSQDTLLIRLDPDSDKAYTLFFPNLATQFEFLASIYFIQSYDLACTQNSDSAW